MTSGKGKPLIRQFMVSAGVSLSMTEHSLVAGYTAILLPQLRDQPSFHMDDTTASWIASIVAFSNTIGILGAPPLLRKYGRRLANLISAAMMILGWLSIALATNVTTVIFARLLQGIALGVTASTGSVLIAEYTTPKYRGAFLTMMCFALLAGAPIVHTLGSFLTWSQTAFFGVAIAVTDFVLILLSPESPLFLVTRGKYDESRKVFHWLRGFEEEEELDAMIKADVLRKAAEKKSKTDVKGKLNNTFQTIKKSEFYKPLIIMLHLSICLSWAGSIMMDVYGTDIFYILIGKDVNVFFMFVSMGLVRIASSIFATVLNTKVRRRLMIIIFVNLNVLVYFTTAFYSYAKINHWITYDPHIIGAFLVYLLMFAVGAGTGPIVNIINGEIFPLKYKNVSVMIDALFRAFNISIMLKLLPQFLSTFGLHGAYAIYGTVVLYGMVVVLFMLPETKDLTLQNIEETYWTKKKIAEETKHDELRDLVC